MIKNIPNTVNPRIKRVLGCILLNLQRKENTNVLQIERIKKERHTTNSLTVSALTSNGQNKE